MVHLDLPEITDDTMRAALSTIRSYTVVILKRTANFARPAVDPIVWEHGRRNFALRAAGWLPIVCPVMDDSDVSGVGIFNADVDRTREIMDGDPGVLAGIFTYEAHACRGFPGSSLPQGTLRKP
jgi:hypothetical protein